uniref:Large ribosomal subunit protein uL23c n=1 Tax=Campylaephora sungminbooi TaxID=1896769 RepID=A0A1B0RRM3_9FLOR|nr:ribosomal protein L23 [Campylaephora sungminbooi]AKU47421.1 ribosomal protein L23 [Campylaephora sungminbooi]ALN11868.1 ribosomal protein L23 [Campylaephora sungminbooi]
MMKIHKNLLEIIKYPIITDKTTQYIEDNKYCFAVDYKANKTNIKAAIEYLFNVKVTKVNTSKIPPKTKKVGRFIGKKTKYKKAIIELNNQYKINLFDEN